MDALGDGACVLDVATDCLPASEPELIPCALSLEENQVKSCCSFFDKYYLGNTMRLGQVTNSSA